MSDPVQLIQGHATVADTSSFARNHHTASAAGFFRAFADGLTVSSIGLGTGGISDELMPGEREAVYEAMELSLRGGLNLVDTADIYGFGEAESVTGAVLARMFFAAAVKRSELIVCSKAGYFHPQSTLLDRHGDRLPTDIGIVKDYHSIHPSYLDRALNLSCERLGLATIDAYLLHNPEEQLVVGPKKFAERVRRAFEFLEQAVADSRIQMYGISTADALLDLDPKSHGLEAMVSYAHDVAGHANHFRIVQVPFNLARPDALFQVNHTVAGRRYSTFAAAAKLGLTILTSVSINGGRISKFIPEKLREACPGLITDFQIALQFARSSPGVCASLVGLRSTAHVLDILRLGQTLPLALGE